MDERFVGHRGSRLRYLVGGTGPPLVLCHGWNGSAENFATWFDDAGARRTLVIPDLPGCGDSQPLVGPHTAESLALAVAAVIDHEGIDRFDLGGVCLGASVSMALLRQRMSSVDRLVLHTPLLAPSLVRRRFHRQSRLVTRPLVWPAVVWMARRRSISDLYKRCFSEGVVEDDQGAAVNFENQRKFTPRAARDWLLDGLSCNDVQTFRRAGRPALVLVAADDRIVDASALAELLADFANVSVVMFGNAGHGWSADFVRRQNAVLTAFLDGRELPARGRVEAA